MWIPGDVKSGAGGCPAHATWASNPMYPFTLEQETKLVAVVTQRDARWQAGGAEYVNGVGFVVVALGGAPDAARVPKFEICAHVAARRSA